MTHSVCFISETARHDRPRLDPAVRYRCHHPADRLLARGSRVTIQSAENFFSAPSLDHSTYVFHRPDGRRPDLARTVEALRSRHRIVMADYDDLVFGDADTAANLAGVRTGRIDLAEAQAIFAGNLAALHLFDRVTVSTAPLRRAVLSHVPGARVLISPNFVPPDMIRRLDRAGLPRRPRATGRIGYFAGTGNHMRDLAEIAGVLHRVLAETPGASLLVAGPVEVPSALAVLPNVRIARAVDYAHLPLLMAQCDTVVAPLESTPFNACKSRVKFLEAALAGCRLVASPIPDMAAVGADHIALADTPDDWYAALTTSPARDDRDALTARNLRHLRDHADCAALTDMAGA